MIVHVTNHRHAEDEEDGHAGRGREPSIVLLYVLDIDGIEQIHGEHGTECQSNLHPRYV